jgi:hypothetical protein
MRTALFWVITQCVMVISDRRFSTADRPRFQGSFLTLDDRLYRNVVKNSGPLKVEPIGCTETSVRILVPRVWNR